MCVCPSPNLGLFQATHQGSQGKAGKAHGSPPLPSLSLSTHSHREAALETLRLQGRAQAPGSSTLDSVLLALSPLGLPSAKCTCRPPGSGPHGVTRLRKAGTQPLPGSPIHALRQQALETSDPTSPAQTTQPCPTFLNRILRRQENEWAQRNEHLTDEN